MRKYYSKNPLTAEQNAFIQKFNKLHKEMIEYYHFSEVVIYDGKFLWDEPEFFIPILDIGKLGFKFKSLQTSWYTTKVCNKETMRAAVGFLADKFPLYIPFFILSMGLTINLSPTVTCNFSLPYGYSVKAVVEEINKNIRLIRELKKSTTGIWISDADEKWMRI